MQAKKIVDLGPNLGGAFPTQGGFYVCQLVFLLSAESMWKGCLLDMKPPRRLSFVLTTFDPVSICFILMQLPAKGIGKIMSDQHPST